MVAGRPEIEINWKIVDDLLVAGCKGREIAANLGIHEDTLYNRLFDEKGVKFSDYSAAKRAKGESLLRAQQFAKAIGASKSGDNMMLIWLGKNRLDQTDSPKQDVSSNENNIHSTIENAKENAKLRQELKELRERFGIYEEEIPKENDSTNQINHDEIPYHFPREINNESEAGTEHL